jgi:hypothetical protein
MMTEDEIKEYEKKLRIISTKVLLGTGDPLKSLNLRYYFETLKRVEFFKKSKIELSKEKLDYFIEQEGIDPDYYERAR